MNRFYFILLFTSFITIVNAQWKPDARLTNDINESASPAVCAAGPLVHVVWFDNRDGNNEIYYKRSANSGNTWGAETRLTNDPGLSYYPTIAVAGSTLHLVWQERRDGNDEIYYKRSTDGGLTWGTDTRLTNDAASSSAPSVAVSGSVVHIVWYDMRDGNNEIYYKKSTDGGTTWGADTRLTNDAGASIAPSIAVSGSSLHVIWSDNRDGNTEIYYKRSTDAGATWGTDKRLTTNSASSDYPSIAVSGINVHVSWTDYRDANLEIYYKGSADAGLNWGADTRLTNEASSSASMYPTIAATGSAVHVLWQENRDGNFEIYFKRSANSGVAWGADTRLTNNPGISRKPIVSAAGSGLHVVWYDDRDGNNEIYYSKDSTYKLTGITEMASAENISIYPNPAKNKLNIKCNPMPVNAQTNILITDITGREVLSYKPLQSLTQLDVSGLNDGLYFVNIYDGSERVACEKVMIGK